MFNVGGTVMSNTGGICSSSTRNDVVDGGDGRRDGGSGKMGRWLQRWIYMCVSGLV